MLKIMYPPFYRHFFHIGPIAVFSSVTLFPHNSDINVTPVKYNIAHQIKLQMGTLASGKLEWGQYANCGAKAV